MLQELWTPEGEILKNNPDLQPWNVYPRPQMKRDSYLNLNGKWEFSVTKPEFTEKTIVVPFCPESLLSGISLSMMISGGIGNMIDRTARGSVVDMIHLDIFNETRLFASINTVFNVADILVCVGACLLVLALMLEMSEELKREKLKKSSSQEDKE